MGLADILVPELQQEASTTRRVIERIPADKFSWKACDKSNTIGWVVNHLAEIPGWVVGTFENDVWDIHPAGGEPYQSPALATTEAVLELFDENVRSAVAALSKVSDEDLKRTWSLASGGNILLSCSKLDVMRYWVLNHSVHHRAILSVYMRLSGIPVPAIYGPSADEQPNF